MGGMNQQQQPAANEQLFQYLNALLQKAEAESGTPELELRSKIEALRTETQRVPTASTSVVDVASKLDELSAKMETVHKLVKEVEIDPDTRSFLSRSSDLWMPVITATAEQRKAASSPSESTVDNSSNRERDNSKSQQ